MTGEKRNAFLFAHQANIERYQRILQTQLTAEERRFVERRIAEQQAALKQLASHLPKHAAQAGQARGVRATGIRIVTLAALLGAGLGWYQRVLQTRLSAEERRFVERRIAEQQAALKQLASQLPKHAAQAGQARGIRATESRIVTLAVLLGAAFGWLAYKLPPLAPQNVPAIYQRIWHNVTRWQTLLPVNER